MMEQLEEDISICVYLLLVSGLLNVLSFLYGCMLMVVKSIYRKNELRRMAYVGMLDNRKLSMIAHTSAKAILNMSMSLLLLSSALYLTVTSEVSYKPFFSYNTALGYSMCILLAVCIFNLVLLILAETLCLRNVHEVPLYLVTSLICIAIIVKQEDALAGVICQLMFGSVFSDELYRIRSIRADPTEKKCNKGLLIFRICMHVLCNTVFPLIMFFIPCWFTKEKFFEMQISSIIIFFFAATFFILCNIWRFNCLIVDFVARHKDNNTTVSKDHVNNWYPNAALSTVLMPILSNKYINDPTKNSFQTVFKNSNNYYVMEGVPLADSKNNDVKQMKNIIYKPSAVKPLEKTADDVLDVNLEKIDTNVIF